MVQTVKVSCRQFYTGVRATPALQQKLKRQIGPKRVILLRLSAPLIRPSTPCILAPGPESGGLPYSTFTVVC